MANNGIGAVKFMRSVSSWAYKAFGSERALTLVAMATPEDMRMVGCRRIPCNADNELSSHGVQQQCRWHPASRA